MSSEQEEGIETIEIPYPQVTKQPLVFVIDTSGSMGATVGSLGEGRRIDRLIYALKLFKEELLKDATARRSVEVAVVAFGGDNDENGVRVLQDFINIEEFNVPENITPEGLTPLAHALLKAVDLVEKRKKIYKQNGINYYRPWIWLITDGFPTDIMPSEFYVFVQFAGSFNTMPNNVYNMLNDILNNIGKYCGAGNNALYNTLIERLREGIKNKKFVLWSIVVGSKNEPDAILGHRILKECIMAKVDPSRPPLFMEDTKEKWREMAKWLSASMRRVSSSSPGEKVKLPAPGWGEVEV